MSSLVPLFQSESKCETILMKMTLICMKKELHAKLIITCTVSPLESFSNRGTRELGNGLVHACSFLFHIESVISIKFKKKPNDWPSLQKTVPTLDHVVNISRLVIFHRNIFFLKSQNKAVLVRSYGDIRGKISHVCSILCVKPWTIQVLSVSRLPFLSSTR